MHIKWHLPQDCHAFSDFDIEFTIQTFTSSRETFLVFVAQLLVLLAHWSVQLCPDRILFNCLLIPHNQISARYVSSNRRYPAYSCSTAVHVTAAALWMACLVETSSGCDRTSGLVSRWALLYSFLHSSSSSNSVLYPTTEQMMSRAQAGHFLGFLACVTLTVALDMGCYSYDWQMRGVRN